MKYKLSELAKEIREEISRINQSCGETVFNPALTTWLDSLKEPSIEGIEMIWNEVVHLQKKAKVHDDESANIVFDNILLNLFPLQEGDPD